MKLAQSVGNTVSGHNADDGITTGWICVNLGAVDDASLPDVETHENMRAEGEDVAQSQHSEGGQTLEKLRLKAQETPEEDEDEYYNPGEDYVGFGARTNSPRIVVQMFTEEKRVEMDLEGLWDIRNTRRARKDERATAHAEAAIQMLRQEQEQEEHLLTMPEVDQEVSKEEVDSNDEDDAAARIERGGETKIEEEIDDEEAREELGEEKPLGSIGGS